MKLFVWTGKNVLTEVGTGLVVVAAEDLFGAWERLKREDYRTWASLWHGISYVDDAAELARLDEDDFPEGWVMPLPTEYDIADLPVLVKRGSS
ncbi:hypothetical protein BAJUN_01210 [Bajunvirus bajun]|uniref:Uncharacterized protein n=1 Tax=Brevundimonas phage vB_BgoS-Bajun TaxID=2948594 RepID=A0A9E7ST98_9CAUD|nr:hypothetical protein BAJUN_01210 [Brevundimonas phage vB_BgoS-Bajun]